MREGLSKEKGMLHWMTTTGSVSGHSGLERKEEELTGLGPEAEAGEDVSGGLSIIGTQLRSLSKGIGDGGQG